MEIVTKYKGKGKSAPINKGRYQRLFEKLIYLLHIGLDIGFIVSVANQFMNNPTKEHMDRLYHILRHLKKTLGKGLYFKKIKKRNMEVFTNMQIELPLLIED